MKCVCVCVCVCCTPFHVGILDPVLCLATMATHDVIREETTFLEVVIATGLQTSLVEREGIGRVSMTTKLCKRNQTQHTHGTLHVHKPATQYCVIVSKAERKKLRERERRKKRSWREDNIGYQFPECPEPSWTSSSTQSALAGLLRLPTYVDKPQSNGLSLCVRHFLNVKK